MRLGLTVFALLSLATPAFGQGVPELPGAGRPVDLNATRARRSALAQRIGKGMVVIPAAEERDPEAQVIQDNDFRQDDYFFYLTGLETAGAWLVMIAAPDTDRTYLFLTERDPGEERWTGIRLGPGADAQRLSGIANTLPIKSLDSALTALLRNSPGPLYLPLNAEAESIPRIHDWVYGGRDVRNVVPALDSMRVFKDGAELARLKRAINITAEGIRQGMQAVRPTQYEYQLEAVIEGGFRGQGADRVGFPSIVGSGPNGTTFHYDVNRRQMNDGDLVLTDVGTEYGQYAADVTRTFPVNGRFSQRQKAIYDLVLATQQTAMDSVRPGITVRDLNRIAKEYMRVHSGKLCGDRTCEQYFNHGLSHWLGMRVHDVGNYAIPLGPGAVITVEPGIYLPDENLGIRIEDDILVTDKGYELLSGGVPRTTADIEALMRGRKQAERE